MAQFYFLEIPWSLFCVCFYWDIIPCFFAAQACTFNQCCTIWENKMRLFKNPACTHVMFIDHLFIYSGNTTCRIRNTKDQKSYDTLLLPKTLWWCRINYCEKDLWKYLGKFISICYYVDTLWMQLIVVKL